MTRESKKPNLFIALEINPALKWNEEEFARKLKEKQGEWSKDSMRPDKKALVAKAYLENLAVFKRIAADPELRETEAKNARESQDAGRAAKIQELDIRLRSYELRGYVLEAEIQVLAKEFGDAVSLADIRKRVKVPVKAQGDNRPVSPRAKTLDPTTANRIRQLLDTLELTDLYDFLQCPPATENHLLRDRADQERLSALRKAVKTAELTARQELAGFCLTIFQSDEVRSNYDETLYQDRLKKLTAAVDQVAAVSRELIQVQIDALLREATKWRIKTSDAQSTVLEHARAKGYAVVLSRPTAEPPKLRSCPSCQTPNDESRNNCTQCGKLLQSPCPNCSKPVACDDRACGACGFVAGNRAYVELMLTETDLAIDHKDYQLASSLLAAAKGAWPARDTDPLIQEIQKRGLRIATLESALVRLEDQLKSAVDQREFIRARRLLGELKNLRPQDGEQKHKQWEIVIHAIEGAGRLVSESKTLVQSQPDEAIAKLQEALAICADCEEARTLLEKQPPDPPANLQARVRGKVVQLAWEESHSIGISYVIVRKARTRPASAKDGDRLHSIAGRTFDDEGPEIGVPLFYAVYSERSGVVSAEAALLVDPVMVLADIVNLSVTVDSGMIQLAWQVPSIVHDVLIVRSELRAPKKEAEGTTIASTSFGLAIDRGLVNGTRYWYTLWARYKDIDERLQNSKGVSVEAIPDHRPTAIEKFDIIPERKGISRTIALKWGCPPKGEIAFLHTHQSTGLEIGAVLSKGDFESLGQLLTGSGTDLSVDLEGSGVHFFTPATIFQQMAYVGAEQRYVDVENITDLRARNLGFAVRLEWRWPSGCVETTIVWSTEGWSLPNAPRANSQNLTYARYSQIGYFDILNPGSTALFIAVYAIGLHNGERIISDGLPSSARVQVALGSRMTIRYSLKRAWLGDALALLVEKQGNGSWPSLVLVHKSATLPLNNGDGEIVLRIPAIDARIDRQKISLPKTTALTRGYARLFLEDAKAYDRIVVHDPEPERLRLQRGTK